MALLWDVFQLLCRLATLYVILDWIHLRVFKKED
jgi:hypothetical protein